MSNALFLFVRAAVGMDPENTGIFTTVAYSQNDMQP